MNARSIAAVLFSVLLTGLVWAADEGIEYTTIEKPLPTNTGDKIEVLELFWYSCPHCYHLEPSMETWKKTKPENVAFEYLPAVFNQRTAPYARAFYSAKSIGEFDKFHMPLFRALHDQKRKIFSDDQLIAFAAEQGIDEEKFRAAMTSFEVDMAVRRAADLSRRSGADGVPALVINGKYLTSPSQVGSSEKMIVVLNGLIAEESKVSVAEPPPAEAESAASTVPDS